MPPPNDLILNRLTEGARRAYAPGCLCFESSTSARVNRRVYACRVHLDTTMIYTHVLNRGGRGVFSPADIGPDGNGIDGHVVWAPGAAFPHNSRTLGAGR